MAENSVSPEPVPSPLKRDPNGQLPLHPSVPQRWLPSKTKDQEWFLLP